jgi:hypothetical protein
MHFGVDLYEMLKNTEEWYNFSKILLDNRVAMKSLAPQVM